MEASRLSAADGSYAGTPARPRADRLRVAIGAVALLGIAVAGYLTYVHYAGLQPFCVAGGGGCEKVQTSDYAKLAGVPVAVLGLGAYLVLAASAAVRGATAALVGAAVAVIGFAFSAYLTYLELFVIDAICQWCVASAILMTVLACLTVARLLRTA
jgi:uncharacterized membrane protein